LNVQDLIGLNFANTNLLLCVGCRELLPRMKWKGEFWLFINKHPNSK